MIPSYKVRVQRNMQEIGQAYAMVVADAFPKCQTHVRIRYERPWYVVDISVGQAATVQKRILHGLYAMRKTIGIRWVHGICHAAVRELEAFLKD